MTLRELQYLIALADHRHFGHAADACHVSQPTLSTQLRKLEDHLGITLFERNNKSLQITPIGERVVEKARRMLAEAESIVDLAKSDANPLTGKLRLGIIPTLSPYLLPWLLPAIKADYPSLEMVINEDMTDILLDHLKTHTIDAALLALPVESSNLQCEAIFDEPFYFACPHGHALARKKHISQPQLQEEKLLLLTDGHCLRQQALAVCGLMKESSYADIDFRATSLETLRQLVIAGMGSTLLPALALENSSNDELCIRPLQDEASRQIGLVWRENYSRVADMTLFAQLIRDNLPKSVNPV